MINEQYPSKLLEHAVQELSRLPGVGRKTALRFALYLLKQDNQIVEEFSKSLLTLRNDIKHCKVCHNISDTDICDICSNPQRDKTTICVVENIHSVMSIENTNQYHGLYHVLGGVISPMDGVGPSDIELESLFNRVQNEDIKEIILDTLQQEEKEILHLAQYLPWVNEEMCEEILGTAHADLEYTDEVTLGRSILGRTPLK